MNVHSKCPCGKQYLIPLNNIGKKAKCKACGQVFLLTDISGNGEMDGRPETHDSTLSGINDEDSKDYQNPSSVTKECPFCAETIKSAAVKCRYCGEDLAASESNGFQAEGGVASSAKDNTGHGDIRDGLPLAATKIIRDNTTHLGMKKGAKKILGGVAFATVFFGALVVFSETLYRSFLGGGDSRLSREPRDLGVPYNVSNNVASADSSSLSNLPSQRVAGHWKFLFAPENPSLGYSHVWYDFGSKTLTMQTPRGVITRGHWRIKSENPIKRELWYEWSTKGPGRDMTVGTLAFSPDYTRAVYSSSIVVFGRIDVIEDEWIRVDDATSP